jgi:hypothetical protein
MLKLLDITRHQTRLQINLCHNIHTTAAIAHMILSTTQVPRRRFETSTGAQWSLYLGKYRTMLSSHTLQGHKYYLKIASQPLRHSSFRSPDMVKDTFTPPQALIPLQIQFS